MNKVKPHRSRFAMWLGVDETQRADGQAMAEYALTLGAVATVCIVAIDLLDNSIAVLLARISASLS